MTDEVAEPADVDRADLFHEYAGRLIEQYDFRAERGRPSTSGGRCHQNDGTREELIGLDDDPESITALLVAHTLRDLQAEDVTPQHAGTP